MQRPKFGRTYVFVELDAGEVVACTGFTAYADGSGGIAAPTGWGYMDGCWRTDLARLVQLGFTEFNEAQRQGLLNDSTWVPPEAPRLPWEHPAHGGIYPPPAACVGASGDGHEE